MTNGQNATGGSYEFEICHNGIWRIYVNYPTYYSPILLGKGSLQNMLKLTNNVAVAVNGSKKWVLCKRSISERL